MSRILVPGDLRDTLSGIRGRSAFVDDTGKVLGYFIPSESLEESPFGHEDSLTFPQVSEAKLPGQSAESGGRSWDEIQADLEAGYFRFPSISEDEIQRRRQQKSGRTLAEIWARLGVRQ